MSNPGERDDALEVEEVETTEVEVEQTEAEDGAEDEEHTDEAGDEPAEGGEGQPAAVAAKPRSAATIAVQEAKRAAKEAKAEAEATRRELNDLRQAAQGRQTAEQAELDRQRVALMAPEEKYEYLLNKQAEQTRTQVGALQFQMHDATDRSRFDGLCVRVPAYAAIQDLVEDALGKARAQGGNPSRETVAKYLIGERAVAAALRGGKTKQVRKGQENIQRQTVKAPAGRSDVPGGERRAGGNDRAARAARLGDLEI